MEEAKTEAGEPSAQFSPQAWADVSRVITHLNKRRPVERMLFESEKEIADRATPSISSVSVTKFEDGKSRLFFTSPVTHYVLATGTSKLEPVRFPWWNERCWRTSARMPSETGGLDWSALILRTSIHSIASQTCSCWS